MPYKRKRSKRGNNTQTNKQKKLITSRLMNISLKVDGYVYKNRTIEVQDAEKYLQEVTSYRELCGNDERCLQVIEKLTRIMKGIIAEQQETTSDIAGIGNYTVFGNNDQMDGSISPVYSLPNEDRTLISQNVLSENMKSKNNVIPQGGKEVIDLCDSDDEILEDEIIKNIEVDIHRAISNLSLIATDDLIQASYNECSQSILKNYNTVGNDQERIRQNNAPVPITSIDDECSQSILKNFENIDIRNEQCRQETAKISTGYNPVAKKDLNPTSGAKIKPIKILSNDPIKKVFTSAITPTGIQMQNAISIEPNAQIDPVTLNTNTIAYNYRNEICSTNHIENTELTKSINSTTNSLNKISSIDVNSTKGSDSKNTKPNNLSGGRKNINSYKSSESSLTNQYNIANAYKKNKSENAKVNTNQSFASTQAAKGSNSCNSIKINETNKYAGNSVATTTHKKKPGKKTQDVKEKKNKGTPKIESVKKKRMRKNDKASKKVIEIYNNNTENDLSWVENIRYVREINVNEYDPQLVFEDEFWDNYSLPGICKYSDFNY